MDFDRLQNAVDETGVRRRGVDDDYTLPSGTANVLSATSRSHPLRARYPNFRWRLIPSVYCLFYACYFVSGFIYTYLSKTLWLFNAETLWTYSIVIVAFAVSAASWFNGRWVTAIVATVLAHAVPSLVSSILGLI